MEVLAFIRALIECQSFLVSKNISDVFEDIETTLEKVKFIFSTNSAL